MQRKILRVIGMLMAAAILLPACTKSGQRQNGKQTFTDEVRIKATPVKNQGNGELCWLYAMLATIESEHLMLGDSVNLSVDYLSRLYLEEKAVECYFTRGHRDITLRGMITMGLNLLQVYGAVPYDSYHAKKPVNYYALKRRLISLSRMSYTLDDFSQRMRDQLDEHIEYLPTVVFMLGAQYTPLEFAHSVCRKHEYEALTSFTHHHFGEPFVLELPDNKMNDQFMNVPIDTLMNLIENSLRKGHPVCWEGDTSEPGFNFDQGVARLSNESTPVTQQMRQHEFERLLTSDDHAMELVGIAHDSKGHKYFIAKNSWGTGNRYGGYMYLSYNYVKMKTIAVAMQRMLLREEYRIEDFELPSPPPLIPLETLGDRMVR